MTATDRTAEPDAVFDAHLAGWEAADWAEESAVEKVARAIHAGRYVGYADAREIALIAIEALRGPASADDTAAIERVRALADELEAEAKRHDDAEPVSTDGLTRMIAAARQCRHHASRIRAAVAGDQP